MGSKTVSKKQNRRFLNAIDKTCLASVTWHVEVSTPYKEGKKHQVDANICISREGRDHWVTSKGDLKAVRTIQTELNRFEAECVSAFEKAEELDAKSKK